MIEDFEMAEARRIRLAEAREEGRNSVDAKINRLHDGFRKIAACFIDARDTSNEMAKEMRELISKTNDNRRVFEAILGRDLSWPISTEGISPNEIEDESQFADLLAKMSAEKDPRARDRRAYKVKMMIDESLESWNSKLMKLKMVSSAAGSTESEESTAFQRFVRIENIIAALKKRGETIDSIHDQAMSEMEKFVAKSRANWKRARK